MFKPILVRPKNKFLYNDFFKNFLFYSIFCSHISTCFVLTDIFQNSSSSSLVKLYIFQIKRSLTLDQKRHHGKEH